MRKYTVFICALISLFSLSCTKFLETKSDQKLATPSAFSDLEAILNNSVINIGTTLLNGMADEYYVDYSDWQNRPELEQQGYTWDAELDNSIDWNIQYYAAFNANTVLFNLELINSTNADRSNKIKGTALFYRALAFYRVAQLFAPQYLSTTASSDLGIPLRLSADINEISKRSTLQQTYDQIISDLEQAAELLPSNVPNSIITKTQPTKAAAYGLLARIYLQIGNYTEAKKAVNNCFQIHNVLMNFNDNTWVNPNSSTPFALFNPEIVFYSKTDLALNTSSVAKVDSNLYNSYAANDIRKTAYFSLNDDLITYRFKGTYTGEILESFCGVATDELYLIRAECFARENDITSAMKDLNDLLRTRWEIIGGVSTYIDQTATDADDALRKILSERKKELIYRELRWPDLRRLNKETALESTLVRNHNGQIISLPPNDLRYTLLIPEEVMRIVSLQQNPR